MQKKTDQYYSTGRVSMLVKFSEIPTLMLNWHIAVYARKPGLDTVRYHDDGSKELNTCILLLAHMVYL
jgi:hypothetical protein